VASTSTWANTRAALNLSVDLTDALGRISAPQPAGGAVDVAAQLHEAPTA